MKNLMTLILMYKDKHIEEIKVEKIFQQRNSIESDGVIDRLYFEKQFTEKGKADNVKLDELICWQIEI